MSYEAPSPANSYCQLSLDKNTLGPLGKDNSLIFEAGTTKVYAGYKFKDSKENDIPFDQL